MQTRKELIQLQKKQNEYSSFDAPEQGSAGGSSAVNFGREDGQVVHNPLFDAAEVNAPSSD